MTTVRTDRAAGAARVRSEHIITLKEAQLLFPDGQRPTIRRLLRWTIGGTRRRNGVRLDSAKIGGKNHTSIEAVRRFRLAAGL